MLLICYLILFINEAYDNDPEYCDNAIVRYSTLKTSTFILIKIILLRMYHAIDEKTRFLPEMINLKENFRPKATKHEYINQ